MQINTGRQGDCLEEMKKMPDRSIDMVLCDLPYGTTECKWDKKLNEKLLFQEYKRVIKNNRAIVIMMAYPNIIDILSSHKEMFKYSLIWIKNKKTNFANAKNRPLRQHEEIFVFSNGNTANGSKNKMFYNPQNLIKIDKKMMHKSNRNKKSFMGIRDNYQKNVYVQTYTNYPSTVLFYDSEHGLHSTQKPVALMEYLIKTYTNEGDTVLDNCMGSGTTGVACKNLNRSFIGIELDAEYFKIAQQRINNTTNLFAQSA